MFTSAQLVEYCKKVYASKWVYWYGTYGLKCGEALYSSKRRQYPTHYTAARAAGYQRDIAEGRWCADCVGMIKSFFWKCGDLTAKPVYGSNHCPDVSANGMIALCEKSGAIRNMPDEPGLVVWKSGHIGVYIGDGYTIEMRGFDYDCVRRRVKDGPWTKWGRLPASMITYGATPAEPEPVEPEPQIVGLRRGDHGSAVTQMQRALLVWNPTCLPKYGADGDFGAETEGAVKAYQAAAGLPVTGVYDESTRTALMSIGRMQRVIATGDVNVRSAPGITSKILGVLKKGNTAHYQGEKSAVDERDWYLIDFENQNGWVSSKYSRVE